MRALIQRVLEAKVVVDGETTGEIQHGLLVFFRDRSRRHARHRTKAHRQDFEISYFLMMSKAKWAGMYLRQMAESCLFHSSL